MILGTTCCTPSSVVGVTGIEPATFCSRNRRASTALHPENSPRLAGLSPASYQVRIPVYAALYRSLSACRQRLCAERSPISNESGFRIEISSASGGTRTLEVTLMGRAARPAELRRWAVPPDHHRNDPNRSCREWSERRGWLREPESNRRQVWVMSPAREPTPSPRHEGSN